MAAEDNVALQWNVRVKGQRGEGWRREDRECVLKIEIMEWSVVREEEEEKWLPLGPVLWRCSHKAEMWSALGLALTEPEATNAT